MIDLRLDGSEAGVEEGVVVAVVGPAHALADAGASEHLPIAFAGILSAAIGVMNDPLFGLATDNGLTQGGKHQILVHSLREFPADDSSRVEIHHDGKIGETAGFQRNICDIGEPDLVRRFGRRRIEDAIGIVAERMSALRRFGPERPRLNGAKAELLEEPRHAASADRNAAFGQFADDPPGSIASAMLAKDVLDHWQQPTVFGAPLAVIFMTATVIAGPADSQQSTGERNGNSVIAQCIDGRITIGYPPREKMAKAFFKTSRSRST